MNTIEPGQICLQQQQQKQLANHRFSAVNSAAKQLENKGKGADLNKKLTIASIIPQCVCVCLCMVAIIPTAFSPCFSLFFGLTTPNAHLSHLEGHFVAAGKIDHQSDTHTQNRQTQSTQSTLPHTPHTCGTLVESARGFRLEAAVIN